MKFRCIAIILSLSFVDASVALCADPKPKEPAKYLIDTKSIRDKDLVAIKGDAKLTHIDVHLFDGIGSAKIQLDGGTWPRKVVVRVHSSMLESFSLKSSNGKESKFGFSHSLNPRTGEWKHHKHGDESLKVKVVTKGAKGAADFFEFTIPAAMHAGDSKWFSLRWVDAYRQ